MTQDMQHHHQTSFEGVNTDNPSTDAPSLVPIGVTIGLGIFALILGFAGYGFRLAAGEPIELILRHAAVVVPAFVIGYPLLILLGAVIMNKIKGTQIQFRNAWTLGWLLSCVTMLWLMGVYS